MKIKNAETAILTFAIGAVVGIILLALTHHPTIFYDGEGNMIPNRIVELEVKSHFVILSQLEQDSVKQYFYDLK